MNKAQKIKNKKIFFFSRINLLLVFKKLYMYKKENIVNGIIPKILVFISKAEKKLNNKTFFKILHLQCSTLFKGTGHEVYSREKVVSQGNMFS